MKTYHGLVQTGKKFELATEPTLIHNRLSPGCYTTHLNQMSGQFWFEEFKTQHDKIIDLPSPEYKQLTKEMTNFLKPEIKKKFEEKGFLYKRSALLYGSPGTGKTVLVNRVIQEVIKSGGIVLFTTDPRLLPKAYEIIDDLQPEVMTLVVIEEFDTIIKNYGESIFLNLLDGEVQKQNVMYLATTNYINKIPKRMIRPGRMSSTIEVLYPNAKCRHLYFSMKMGENFSELSSWVEKTAGLSVDELKEIVQSVYIFDNQIEDVVTKIKKTRDFSEINMSEDLDEDY